MISVIKKLEESSPLTKATLNPAKCFYLFVLCVCLCDQNRDSVCQQEELHGARDKHKHMLRRLLWKKKQNKRKILKTAEWKP